MKGFLRENLRFSLCGLNCGLCAMRAGGYCPGCGGGDGNQPCKFARCAQKRGVEYCFGCDGYPCEKYAGFDEYDSFITHQRREKDIRSVKENGIGPYCAVQREKQEILEYLLENCNDGRKKSFFCLAVNLLDMEDIKPALDRAALNGIPDMKARAACAAEILKKAAERRGILLKLRKKPKREKE